MGSYQNNKKSPSFHSNKSENMSVDANLNNSQLAVALPTDETLLSKTYEDHWFYEQIVLERVGFFFFLKK